MAGGPFYISAFWEGTANTLNPPTTQLALFADACLAEDIGGEDSRLQFSDGPFKIAFDGCGVTNGLFGTLFATGIYDQARQVAGHVKTLLMRGRPVVLNAFGLSRGGIAVLYLLQHLQDQNKDMLTINAMLFDPVPGNQVNSGFPFTAIGSKDVSECKPLRRVLAIYPHEPLPWISFHAPLLPTYPPSAVVEEDVWLGCHQGACFGPRRSKDRMAVASNLSFRRIVDFCDVVGTKLNPQHWWRYEPTQSQCLQICREELNHDFETSRELHDATGSGRTIVRRRANFQGPRAKYLNKYHEALEKRFSSGEIDKPQGSWEPNVTKEARDAPLYMLGFDSYY